MFTRSPERSYAENYGLTFCVLLLTFSFIPEDYLPMFPLMAMLFLLGERPTKVELDDLLDVDRC